MPKTCKQCGEAKPESQFRKYYGGRKGTYNTCKLCEKINSREKYLANKLESCSASPAEQEEFEKIHKLWEYQTTLGLRPPRTTKGKETPITENLDDMLQRYGTQASIVVNNVPIQANNVPPYDLVKWLAEPLTKEPEYYQETVYEDLKKKYRQQLGYDKKTGLPAFDDTYREILQSILARFDSYEDTYYDKN